MKEHRLQVFRAAVEGLIESLEAVIRLSRWTEGGEAKPEPLVASAGKLLDRLGSANRLAASRFHGSAAEVTKVNAICVVLRRLDAAYLLYRQQLEAVQNGLGANTDAASGLETELALLTEGSAAWR